MPVTKKSRSSKKAAPNSSTKTTKKPNKFLSAINFRSKKIQLLVVVLAFGIIGGSYYVYKSYAAVASYAYTSNNLTPSQPDGGKGVETSGKASTAYTWIRKNGSLNANPGIPMSPANQYQVCIDANAESTGVGGRNTINLKAGLITGGSFVNESVYVIGGGYRTYCTAYHTANASGVGNALAATTDGGTTRFHSVTINWMPLAAAPAPAPAPAPAK